MTSASLLCRATPVLLLVVAHLALLQHATRVEAGTLNHLDYVAKKGQTKADKRGAKLPTVKKELDPDEEVAAVELEPVEEEDADGEEPSTTTRPTAKSRSGLGAWWSTIPPNRRFRYEELLEERKKAKEKKEEKEREAKAAAEADAETDEDDEDKVVDPLNHEGNSKASEGDSRASMSDFDVGEKEEGQAPMVVLKIHPVESKKSTSHSGSAKPTLSPSMDKLVHDNKGKTGPNGTVVITIKPELTMLNKLNKTGEVEGFGTVIMKKKKETSSSAASSASASSSSSSITITNDGGVVKTESGTTTRIPTFKLSSTPASFKMVTESLPKKLLEQSTTAKPTTGKPTTGKPTSGKPATGKPTTGKPTTDKSKPTTKKPDGKKPPTTKAPTPVNCPCMTAKPITTPKSTTPKPTSKGAASTKKPTASTGKPAAKPTTKSPASVKPTAVATSAPSTKNQLAGHCTARPDCQCNYQEMKDTDKMLAVVITNRGGFKGRRLNSKAIAQIMSGKVDLQQMLDIKAQKSITVSSNNTYVLPAGHYYFPHPIRFAGFVSP